MASMKDLLGDQPAPFIYNEGPGHRHVGTSVIAANSMRPHVGKIQQRILDHLKTKGSAGSTYQEIMEGCELGAPTVCGRLVELTAAKLIKISGTRLTASRRPARVYVLAEFVAE